jgi:hypothetical protein
MGSRRQAPAKSLRQWRQVSSVEAVVGAGARQFTSEPSGALIVIKRKSPR